MTFLILEITSNVSPGIDSALIWPEERMFVTVGSTHSHFIGLDMIGAILDEANFREQAATKRQRL